jgi:transposase-like protein
MAEERKALTLRELERLAILDALERNSGNKDATARALGIGRTTLYRWLKEAGLSNQDDGGLRHEQLCALKRRTGQMNPADTETLIKAIHAECNRVRRVIPDYESRVSSPGLARDILLLAITQAEESIASGDVARMVKALESLWDFAK